MARFHTLSAAISMCLGSSLELNAQNVWLSVGTPGISAGVANYQSLAMDASDNPVVAYRDNAYGDKTTVLRWNGNVWSAVGVPGFSAGDAQYISLAIDASDNPVVAYRDHANGNKTTVMRWNGSSWNPVGAPGISAGAAYYQSLAINASGNPVVAYRDSVNGSKTTVMRWSGSAWTPVGTPGISTGVAHFQSLALDASGNPVVAYCDIANGGKTTAERWNGSAWNTIGGAGISAGSATYQSLALDASDNPVVAYKDDANGGKTTVLRWNGSTWSPVGAPGVSAGPAWTHSLALDADGNPVVAYDDEAFGDKTTVLRWNGTEWNPVGAPGISEGVAFNQSLALDEDGDPVVAYYDVANDYKTTVLRWTGPSQLGYEITVTTQPETGQFPSPIPLSVSPHVKLCADGSRATRFTVTVTGGNVDLNQIQFRMANANGDIGYSGSFNNTYEYGSNSITTRYTHPRFMSESGYSRFDHFEVINVSDPNTVLASVPVYIYRAPVAFIHGLGGSASTFAYQSEMFFATGLYPYIPNTALASPLIWRANYGLPSLQGFSLNRKVVPDAIDALLHQAIASGYSCGKAIVIGHSMGGVLARVYLQVVYGNPAYRNDIQRLVTLNTPHYGTQLANRCTQPPILFGLSLNTPPPCSLLGLIGLALGAQSLQDLRTDSAPILALNSQNQTNIVPCATLASIRPGVPNPVAEPGAFAFFTAFSPSIVVANIYQGEQHDLVVPLSSQQSNLELGSVVQPQWHMGSAENISYFDQLAVLVNADPLGSNFSQTGFPQDQLEYLIPAPEDVSSAVGIRSLDEVSIDSPPAGQNYLPGQTVTVEISSSEAIDRMALIVYGNDIDPIVIDTTNVESLQFQVPGEALGELSVNLLGGTEADWTAGDGSYITILPTSVPDSIRADPSAVQLPLGIAQPLSITGYFDEVTGSLLDLPGLGFEFDPFYLAHEGSGVFRGLAVGNTEVVCVYQEMRDTIEFTIVDDPNALIAAFTNTNEHICASDTVHFHDVSQGLVVGHQWSFDGGAPPNSSVADPVVIYSNPGTYSVHLVTTFQNGVDSVTVGQLIVVDQPPVAEILEGDGVLSATTADASYQWLDCLNGGIPILGASEQDFVPQTSGQYAVAITVNACSSISPCVPFMTTGLQNARGGEGVIVAPNPSDGRFIIRIPDGFEGGLIVIKDIAGRELVREPIDKRRQIPIELDVASGTYSVQIHTEHGLLHLPCILNR